MVNKLNKKDIVLPNYDKSILSTISSILKYYNVDNGHTTLKCLDKLLEKKYKNVVLLILDGMGHHILENLDKDGYFKNNQIDVVTSVCPSTTTAAMTTYYSGKCPLESGWIAWSQYFKEYGRCMDVLQHKESYTGEKIKATFNDIYETVIDYKSVFDMIEENGVKAYEIMPHYVERKSKRSFIADNTLELCNAIEDLCDLADKKFIMAYVDNPDSVLHKYGASSDEAKEFIIDTENKIKELTSKLSDTLLIISADHGHKDIGQVYSIMEHPELRDCLIMPEFFESRFIGFWVKEYRKEEFKELFETKFKDFVLLTKEEILEMNLIGVGEKHKKIDDFLGTYVAISTGDSMFRLQNDYFEGKRVKKSTHCGLSKEEMEVPIIVMECK